MMTKIKKYTISVLLTAITFISHCGSAYGISNSEKRIVFENYEQNVLSNIDNKIANVSEMLPTERAFLNGLLRKYKPKKIVELGVSDGGSSAIILNATEDIGSEVYSVDLLHYCYRDHSKAVGHIVKEKFPKLMKRWHLYTGDIPCEFIDKIGNEIDFVLIDNVHTRPGEICDFLTVLPYLSENAIVCFHDIGSSFTWGLKRKPAYYCNDMLFSTIKGEKFLPQTKYTEFFPNIGAIKLDSNQKKYLFDYFFLFTMPWEYLPQNSVNQKLINHFSRHYDSFLVDIYKKAIAANNKYHKKVMIKA